MFEICDEEKRYELPKTSRDFMIHRKGSSAFVASHSLTITVYFSERKKLFGYHFLNSTVGDDVWTSWRINQK